MTSTPLQRYQALMRQAHQYTPRWRGPQIDLTVTQQWYPNSGSDVDQLNKIRAQLSDLWEAHGDELYAALHPGQPQETPLPF